MYPGRSRTVRKSAAPCKEPSFRPFVFMYPIDIRYDRQYQDMHIWLPPSDVRDQVTE